ncbi:RidA family protein [Sphingobacterium griseoflavum]|uniref:Uncharacterized protein n=1 Tax=Sphingobacterium griseoflavum TaxID=1474952 RepID=A0ABQ3HU35_9SPHI|nr:RidA family protein [Sphingobacterium griseoflavum]GHE28920.1 hypothetical protein GCM10017764_09390 [Sphingobacterium griseoflavum]
MEKITIDPWKWGEYTNSAQAVEVKNVAGTLYCSGQVAIDQQGQPSAEDMRSQLKQTIANLEHLITEAGYEMKNIVRLNVYTTSINELFSTSVDIYSDFLRKYEIKQATTLVEVKALFATLTIELEATVVK